MAAPGRARRREACAQAAEHYRREHMDPARPNDRLQVTVDPVPHLAPEVGDTTEWYKVGSLFVEPPSRMLHIYLDARTGAVKLERDLEDVPLARKPVDPS